MITEQAIVIHRLGLGRAVKAKDLGYRLHVAVDVKSELPISMIVVSANENEKKHSISLFARSLEYVKPTKLLADSQYSASNLRQVVCAAGAVPVIPYPKISKKASEAFLGLIESLEAMGQQSSKLHTRNELQ